MGKGFRSKSEADWRRRQGKEIASELTVLDSLRLLASLEDSEQYYNLMLNKPEVRREGWQPSQQSFEWYWELTRQGLKMMMQQIEEQGSEVLPSGIGLCESGYVMGYNQKDDFLVVSYLYLARRCRYLGTSQMFQLKLSRYPISAAEATVIDAAEVGYRRYQVKHSGANPKDLRKNRGFQAIFAGAD